MPQRKTVIPVADKLLAGDVPEDPPQHLFDAGWLMTNNGKLRFGERFGGVVGISVNRESLTWVVSGPAGPFAQGRLDVGVTPVEGESATPEELREWMVEVLKMTADHLPSGALAGVGVAWAGPIGTDGEPGDSTFHHAGFRDPETNKVLPVTPLVREAVESVFKDAGSDATVCLINDADADLLYELRHGVAKGIKNVIALKVCGGLGMAAAHEGCLIRGSRGFAGEIQHIKVRPEEEPLTSKYGEVKDLSGLPNCWCSGEECIGRFVTGAALIALLDKFTPDLGTATARGRKIEQIGEHGAVSAVFNRAGRLLGQAMIGPVLALDPEMIVVNSFPRNSQLVVGLQNRLTDGTSIHVDTTKVVDGTKGVDTTAAGAARLVIERDAVPRMELLAADGPPEVLRRNLPPELRRGIDDTVSDLYEDLAADDGALTAS